jgi:hypothetical protein
LIDRYGDGLGGRIRLETVVKCDCGVFHDCY